MQQRRDGTRLCFNRILLAAENNSLSGGKVEAGRMWTILKLKPVRFPKRSDLGWERREMARRTPGFWKDRRAVSELGGCMRSLLGEAHWELGFVCIKEGCPLGTQLEKAGAIFPRSHPTRLLCRGKRKGGDLSAQEGAFWGL